MTAAQLARIRWAVRAALALGVTASVVANVLHALDNPVSQCIAAWPPLALLLTVELISRVPVLSRGLAAARLLATTTIAGIAAWVSYWHMAGVAARYGENGASPYLIPVSVDGLIVVASICLVELGGRIRAAEQPPAGPAGVPEWDYERPIGPLPATAPPATVTPKPTAAPRPRPARPKARTLSAADRVQAAHRRSPNAPHETIAQRTGLSVSTVKRHRPAGSSTADRAAETPILAGSHASTEVTA